MKSPQLVVETVFAFPPNRETLGGTAYLIQLEDGNVLIDCPAWTEETRSFLEQHGGVSWMIITHRTAKGKARELQAAFNCAVIIQEQEAYLLPNASLSTFHQRYQLNDRVELIWTPGHSPGSSCVYYRAHNGILFSGRHLLPDQHGNPTPLRFAKTFHWVRQVHHTQQLIREFSSDTLAYICPGANTGYLRGKRVIDHAYEKLLKLDIDGCLSAASGL